MHHVTNSLRSAGVLAPTFIENPEYANAAASQHGEVMDVQPQSGSTGLGAQVGLMDDYPKKSELLDRETPESGKDFPQVGTSAVLAMKQELQGLIMSVEAVVQNQQEVYLAVQRSLEASVYDGMTSDKG